MNAQQDTLRQMDWRFLVPAPPGGAFQHLLLFGGDARLAETIRAHGIARRVSCDVRGAQGTDAAIVLPLAN